MLFYLITNLVSVAWDLSLDISLSEHPGKNCDTFLNGVPGLQDVIYLVVQMER